MKVSLVLPEGELFRAVRETVAQVLHGHEVVQVFPKKLDSAQELNDFDASDLVIADVSGRNPHVLYFVGRADASKKKIILLGSYAEDFPFELDREPIIYSRDLHYLKEELARRIGATKTGSPADNENDAREKFYSIFGDLLQKHGQEHQGGVRMENEKTFVLTDQDLDLALVQDMARRARELGLRIKLL